MSELKVNLHGRLRDHVDPAHRETMEAVACAIDEVLDLLETDVCRLPVMISHVESCIQSAEKWLSS